MQIKPSCQTCHFWNCVDDQHICSKSCWGCRVHVSQRTAACTCRPVSTCPLCHGSSAFPCRCPCSNNLRMLAGQFHFANSSVHRMLPCRAHAYDDPHQLLVMGCIVGTGMRGVDKRCHGKCRRECYHYLKFDWKKSKYTRIPILKLLM